MKRLHVRERRRIQLFDRPNAWPLVRMHGVRILRQRVVEAAVRRREHAEAVLLFDDVALRLEVRLINRERSHSLALGPQQRLQVIRRNLFVIHGPIGMRVRVVRAADVLGEPVHHFRLHVRGGLEHDVFKQMRKPAAPLGIVLRSDAIPDVDRNRRRGVVLDRVDLEPVRERAMPIVDRRKRSGCRGRGDEKDGNRESASEHANGTSFNDYESA